MLVANAPWFNEARALYARDPEWRTESHALVEISNVLSRHVRLKEITGTQALSLITDVDERLRPRLIFAAHVDALRVSIKYKVSAYDARFLFCADDLGVRLVTDDVKLRRAAPRLTQSLQDALAAPP